MLTYILQVQSARYTKSVSLGQSALHLTGKVQRNSQRANKWSAVMWTKLSTTGWADSIIVISLRTLSGLKWALWTMINPCGQLRAKLFLFYSSQLYHTFWNEVSVWGQEYKSLANSIDGVDATRRTVHATTCGWKLLSRVLFRALGFPWHRWNSCQPAHTGRRFLYA